MAATSSRTYLSRTSFLQYTLFFLSPAPSMASTSTWANRLPGFTCHISLPRVAASTTRTLETRCSLSIASSASHHPLSPRGEGRLAALLRRFEDLRVVLGELLVLGKKVFEVAQRSQIVRGFLGRLEEALRRLEPSPLPLQADAEVLVCVVPGAVDRDRRPAERLGLAVAAELVEAVAEVVVQQVPRVVLPRRLRKRPRVGRDGRRVVPPLLAHLPHRQEAVGPGVRVLLERQDLLEVCGRAVVLPRLVALPAQPPEHALERLRVRLLRGQGGEHGFRVVHGDDPTVGEDVRDA